MSDLINQSMNHEAVYKTAPATPLIINRPGVAGAVLQTPL